MDKMKRLGQSLNISCLFCKEKEISGMFKRIHVSLTMKVNILLPLPLNWDRGLAPDSLKSPT